MTQTMSKMDEIMKLVIPADVEKETGRIQPVANEKCAICGREFKGVQSTDGSWFHPGFNGKANTCNRCLKVVEIKKNIPKYLVKAGIPNKYLESTLDNFKKDADNRRALEFCRKYTLSDNPGIGLFLHGPCGIGKTHLAVSVLREMLLKGYTGLFTSTNDLLYQVRKTFSSNAILTDEETLRQYLSYSFLVLDDFGVEKSSEWVRQTLDHVIYHRDAAVKPVIITSNLDPLRIGEQLDERIKSRIMGMCCVIEMSGKDRRNINGN